MKPVLAAITALGLSLSMQTVHAQATVYRCGDGGRQYSQAPCPDGHGTALALNDARSPEQQAAAKDVAQAEARRGRALEQERKKLEAASPVGAGSLSAAPVKAASPAEARPKTHGKRKQKTSASQADGFKAIAPAPANKKKNRKAG